MSAVSSCTSAWRSRDYARPGAGSAAWNCVTAAFSPVTPYWWPSARHPTMCWPGKRESSASAGSRSTRQGARRTLRCPRSATSPCARSPGLPSQRRVESVANALEQADQVASALCGRPVPRQSAPWFWSDQYDTTIQIAGFHDDADTAVVRGDPGTGHFAVFHLDGARLTAVEAVGSPREAMAGRRWLSTGACPDPLDLADPAVPASKVRMAPHIASTPSRSSGPSHSPDMRPSPRGHQPIPP